MTETNFIYYCCVCGMDLLDTLDDIYWCSWCNECFCKTCWQNKPSWVEDGDWLATVGEEPAPCSAEACVYCTNGLSKQQREEWADQAW